MRQPPPKGSSASPKTIFRRMVVGPYHLIDITKRLNSVSNIALKGHFWGEKYPFKERK